MQPANLGRYIKQPYYTLDKASAITLFFQVHTLSIQTMSQIFHVFFPSAAIHSNTIHITMLYNSPSQSALGSLDPQELQLNFLIPN